MDLMKMKKENNEWIEWFDMEIEELLELVDRIENKMIILELINKKQEWDRIVDDLTS